MNNQNHNTLLPNHCSCIVPQPHIQATLAQIPLATLFQPSIATRTRSPAADLHVAMRITERDKDRQRHLPIRDPGYALAEQHLTILLSSISTST
jgi:hypothetical protein